MLATLAMMLHYLRDLTLEEDTFNTIKAVLDKKGLAYKL